MVICNNDAECMQSSELRRPICICPSCLKQMISQRGINETKDMNDTSIVCGSDGVTYESECKLKECNCRYSKSIYLDYIGKCENSKLEN